MRQLTEDLFHRYTLCYAILYSAITEESQNEWQSFSMQNKSSHTKKGAINIADTVFLLQNPSTTDKIDTKYRVATIAQYGIYTRMLSFLKLPASILVIISTNSPVFNIERNKKQPIYKQSNIFAIVHYTLNNVTFFR